MNNQIQQELQALAELNGKIGNADLNTEFFTLIEIAELALKWALDPVNNVRPSVDIQFFYESSK